MVKLLSEFLCQIFVSFFSTTVVLKRASVTFTAKVKCVVWEKVLEGEAPKSPFFPYYMFTPPILVGDTVSSTSTRKLLGADLHTKINTIAWHNFVVQCKIEE